MDRNDKPVHKLGMADAFGHVFGMAVNEAINRGDLSIAEAKQLAGRVDELWDALIAGKVLEPQPDGGAKIWSQSELTPEQRKGLYPEVTDDDVVEIGRG